MTKSLPPEIWTQITLHLPRNSIARLARTSKHVLNATRHVVYRDVKLKSPTGSEPEYGKETLKLLENEAALASIVLSLDLRPKSLSFTFLNLLALLKKLTKLKSLVLREVDALNPDDQRQFVAYLNSRDIPLESLWLKNCLYVEDEAFGVTRLRSLYWTSQADILNNDDMEQEGQSVSPAISIL